MYKFHARHKDEISFNDGDPVQVLKCFEDLWYEGINLLTGKQGVFPSRYVADILSTEMITCKNFFYFLILSHFGFFIVPVTLSIALKGVTSLQSICVTNP